MPQLALFTSTDLQLSDSGLYTCTASSERGESSWSATLRVSLQINVHLLLHISNSFHIIIRLGGEEQLCHAASCGGSQHLSRPTRHAQSHKCDAHQHLTEMGQEPRETRRCWSYYRVSYTF